MKKRNHFWHAPNLEMGQPLLSLNIFSPGKKSRDQSEQMHEAFTLIG
jgi:hypothetical protein